jgi:hypothetical protein
VGPNQTIKRGQIKLTEAHNARWTPSQRKAGLKLIVLAQSTFSALDVANYTDSADSFPFGSLDMILDQQLIRAAALLGHKGFEPRASWALACKNCRAVVEHFPVPDTLANYYLPDRPKFPPEGLERECANCKVKSIYHATELTFQSERNSSDRPAR